ncbi:MAG: hypothetical protein PHQ88_07495 [Bacteroides sp.]|nr:hypothetical protein [Bacteroides sp.]
MKQMRPEITRITFYHDSNFVIYNDTDSSTDYFHNYSLNQKETAEWINESGADFITVHVVNEDQTIPAVRRLKQICKKCGYEYTDNSHMHHYEIQNVDVYVLEYELRRLKPSLFIISYWNPVTKVYEKSEKPMRQEVAEVRVKYMRTHGYTGAEMRRLPPKI